MEHCSQRYNQLERWLELLDLPGLGVLLHDISNSSDQLDGGNGVIVHLNVLLVELARVFNKQSVVWSHTAVDHTDVLGNRLDLINAPVIVQGCLLLLLSSQHNAIGSLDW